MAKHQAVERDIAVMVDEKITHAALMNAVWAAPTAGLLRHAVLFDIYRPKPAKDPDGAAVPTTEKSMAVRLTLNSDDATLTEEQIDSAVQAVRHSLMSSLDARQRA